MAGAILLSLGINDTRQCAPDFHRLVATIALLAAGAGFSAWVIAPRLKTTSEGLVFFGAVRAHTDASTYVEAVRSAGADRLADARLRHCFDILTGPHRVVRVDC